jgi:hypothetical protein
MNSRIYIISIVSLCSLVVFSLFKRFSNQNTSISTKQIILVDGWKFINNDDSNYRKADYNDHNWRNIKINQTLSDQGYDNALQRQNRKNTFLNCFNMQICLIMNEVLNQLVWKSKG